MNNISETMAGLAFHHIGLLVENMDESIQHYSDVFGKMNISEVIIVTAHQVKVCFVHIADACYIELVQPLGENSTVYNLLKKKAGYYHLGYRVKNISKAVERLEALNYKAMDYFGSEAFAGNRCIFLYTPEAHLIELVEE